MGDSDSIGFKKRFLHFISKAKTTRLACAAARGMLIDCGFSECRDSPLSAGSRTVVCWRDRLLVASVIGNRRVSEGFRVVVAHLDSPHLDLKPHAFFEREGYCYADTHTYGAIKKHQWVGIPLAMRGVIVKKNGDVVQLQHNEIGDDPMLMITDASLHFGTGQSLSNANDLVSYESMDPIIMRGSKKGLLAFFAGHYGVCENDFLSADVEIVPAQLPVEIGFDRSLISAYGQDNRACAFAAVSALCEMCNTIVAPDYTTLLILSDREEVGSVGATGIDGRIVESIIEDHLQRAGERVTAGQVLRYSEALCLDACPGYDPHFPTCSSEGNAASIGSGPCILKYTGGATKGGVSEADIHYVAKIRRLLDASRVQWQYAEVGSSDNGSCGSEANCIAKYGCDVIDVGLPLLNLHAPLEIAAYSDVLNTGTLVKTFLSSALNK